MSASGDRMKRLHDARIAAGVCITCTVERTPGDGGTSRHCRGCADDHNQRTTATKRARRAAVASP